jgi:hypothetical protein
MLNTPLTSVPFVIPTRSRSKHSHLLSYPLGAEALSRALDGVPQHAALTCDFTAGNTHQHLDNPLHLAVSAALYKRERLFYDGPDAEARGVLLPRWSITVFAVPKTLRHAIKNALLADGLPTILKPWLIENAELTGKTGTCAINVEYVVATSRLVTTARSAIQPERA